MFSSLMPKDNFFFDLFDKMCVYLVEGIQILVGMLEKGTGQQIAKVIQEAFKFCGNALPLMSWPDFSITVLKKRTNG